MKPRLSPIHRTPIPLHPFPLPPHTKPSSTFTTPQQISAYLSRPTWSVKSTLLSSPPPPPPPPSSTSPQSNASPAPPLATITPQTLHHLLRLSSLPLPTSPEQESRLLADLTRQLRFVDAIQEVDTEGVEPLVVIRDETAQGVREREVGLGDEEIKGALEREVRVGRRGRVVSGGRKGKRRGEGEGKAPRGKDEKEEKGKGRKLVDDGLGGKWDPLARAGRTVGRLIVVDTARD